MKNAHNKNKKNLSFLVCLLVSVVLAGGICLVLCKYHSNNCCVDKACSEKCTNPENEAK